MCYVRAYDRVAVQVTFGAVHAMTMKPRSMEKFSSNFPDAVVPENFPVTL